MMRLAIVLALAACNNVFGLEQTTVEIDAPSADSDGDGVADIDDNCPQIANDQNDEDRDLVGDVCDNCPLIANTDQANVGDEDAVGDRCDPHPTDPLVDCLIVFDSFNDGAGFSSHWQVETQGTPGTATPRPGEVALDAQAGTLAIELRIDGAPVLGKHDVQLLAQFPNDPTGAVAVGSNVAMARPGAWCLVGERDISFVVTSTNMTSVGGTGPFVPALGDELYLSIETTLAGGAPAIACEAEYGISLREVAVPLDANLPGSPAAIVQDTSAIVTAFTAYRHLTATSTCPTPVFR